MDNKKRVSKILEDIKKVKIQGARNIARAALYAYSLEKTKESKKKLMEARPTEPMLFNMLNKAEKIPYRQILKHFDYAQDEINKNVFRIIKNNSIIFTHCHSTNVVNALIYAKKHGKNFQVYNTETRPLFQGRKTAKELRKSGIKVTEFIDSAAAVAIEKANLVFLGADAILKKGVINKIGSGMFAEIAYDKKVPVYIIADSWKYTNKNVPIENRNLNEVWDKAPKNIKIKNPAFEFIKQRYIKVIVSELGVLSYNDFLKKVGKI